MHQEFKHIVDKRDPDFDEEFDIEKYLDDETLDNEEKWRESKEGEVENWLKKECLQRK